MTELTKAQIEEAKQIGKLFDNPNESPEVCAARCFAYIRREARNAALEEAAKVCMQPNNFIPDDCADSIRHLKDQP